MINQNARCACGWVWTEAQPEHHPTSPACGKVQRDDAIAFTGGDPVDDSFDQASEQIVSKIETALREAKELGREAVEALSELRALRWAEINHHHGPEFFRERHAELKRWIQKNHPNALEEE